MNLNQKNFSISQLKGLKPSQDNLLQIRLADKSMVKKLNDGQEHLLLLNLQEMTNIGKKLKL